MSLAKAEQRALCGPIGGKLSSQSHQAHGLELLWLPAVDDRCGYVRREPAQAEQGIQVARCNAILASNVTHSERWVLGEAPMSIVSARTTPRTLISSDRSSSVILDQQFHFAQTHASWIGAVKLTTCSDDAG